MGTQVGQRLVSMVDTTAVMVVRWPAGDLTLTCGGVEMVGPAEAAEALPVAPTAEQGEGVQLGKRYAVEELGVEVLCTKPGQYALAVNGHPMTPKQAKPLPASD
ncbi:hypothetical protein [Streptomyces gilvus]|uniref:hypothetical protein n=1 Tax=Streptomyces gilvus TaxID=2920937 RepID=UPI001F103155|nr:hypothetical protein [Streptomyces sp. CME 23]MCH5675650.1 hypothetical protein [Streptomyces sp. CME 23]